MNHQRYQIRRITCISYHKHQAKCQRVNRCSRSACPCLEQLVNCFKFHVIVKQPLSTTSYCTVSGTTQLSQSSSSIIFDLFSTLTKLLTHSDRLIRPSLILYLSLVVSLSIYLSLSMSATTTAKRVSNAASLGPDDEELLKKLAVLDLSAVGECQILYDELISKLSES